MAEEIAADHVKAAVREGESQRVATDAWHFGARAIHVCNRTIENRRTNLDSFAGKILCDSTRDVPGTSGHIQEGKRSRMVFLRDPSEHVGHAAKTAEVLVQPAKIEQAVVDFLRRS